MTRDDKKLDTYQQKCLRHILKIRWPMKVTNEESRRSTSSEIVSSRFKVRRWNWFGTDHPRTALTWTTEGKRKRVRPKETWRRTVGKDGFGTWNDEGTRAADRRPRRNTDEDPIFNSGKKELRRSSGSCTMNVTVEKTENYFIFTSENSQFAEQTRDIFEMDYMPSSVHRKVNFLKIFGLLPRSLSRALLCSKSSLLTCLHLIIYIVSIIYYYYLYLSKRMKHLNNIHEIFHLVAMVLVDFCTFYIYVKLINYQSRYMKSVKQICLKQAKFEMCRQEPFRKRSLLLLGMSLVAFTLLPTEALLRLYLKGFFRKPVKIAIATLYFFRLSQLSILFAMPLLILNWITIFTHEMIKYVRCVREYLKRDLFELDIRNIIQELQEIIDVTNDVFGNIFGQIILKTVFVVVVVAMMNINIMVIETVQTVVVLTGFSILMMFLWSREGQIVDDECIQLCQSLSRDVLCKENLPKSLRRRIKHMHTHLMTAPFCLTASGYFYINKSFFLSVVGIITSYGVVVVTFN